MISFFPSSINIESLLSDVILSHSISSRISLHAHCWLLATLLFLLYLTSTLHSSLNWLINQNPIPVFMTCWEPLEAITLCHFVLHVLSLPATNIINSYFHLSRNTTTIWFTFKWQYRPNMQKMAYNIPLYPDFEESRCVLWDVGVVVTACWEGKSQEEGPKWLSCREEFELHHWSASVIPADQLQACKCGTKDTVDFSTWIPLSTHFQSAAWFISVTMLQAPCTQMLFVPHCHNSHRFSSLTQVTFIDK